MSECSCEKLTWKAKWNETVGDGSPPSRTDVFWELSHGLRCGYCKQRMETFCTTSPILHPQTSSISHIPFLVWSLIEPPDCNSISKPQKLERISICTDVYNIVIYIYTHMHFYLVILFELMSPSTSSSARSQKRVKGPSWDNSWRGRLQPQFRNSPVNMWISNGKIGLGELITLIHTQGLLCTTFSSQQSWKLP